MEINEIINNSSFINNLQENNNVHIVINNNKLFIYTFTYDIDNLRIPTNMYILEIKKDGNYIYNNYHELLEIEHHKQKIK